MNEKFLSLFLYDHRFETVLPNHMPPRDIDGWQIVACFESEWCQNKAYLFVLQRPKWIGWFK